MVHRAVGGAAAQQVERLNRMAIVKVLGRVWIPLVVLLVIGCGGFIVSRVHGIFGSEMRPSYAEDSVKDTKPFNPKHLVYEVFGPAGTVADISYFDINSESQHVDGASLPWSLTMTSNSAALIGSIVAQGNSDSIGCRIVVDGEVKAEKISNQVNAFTHCLLEGA
jgi:Mycobacterium membrane protein